MKTLQESILGDQNKLADEISNRVELESILHSLLVERNPDKFNLLDTLDKFAKFFKKERILQEFAKCPLKSKFPNEPGIWMVVKKDQDLSDLEPNEITVDLYYSLGRYINSVDSPLNIVYSPTYSIVQRYQYGRFWESGAGEETEKVIRYDCRSRKYSSLKLDSLYFIPCSPESQLHKIYQNYLKQVRTGRF